MIRSGRFSLPLLLCCVVSCVCLSGVGAQSTTEPTVKNQADNQGDKQADKQAADQADEIRRISEQLRKAQKRLANRDTSDGTQQLQRQSLEQLKKLASELQKQSSSSSTASGANNPQVTQQSPAAPDSDPQGASNPAKVDSVTQASGQRIWGHLRKRLRERMRAAGVEEFLPEYEGMLEAYYRQLGK